MKSYFICLCILICSGNMCAQDIPVNPNLTWNGESSLAINPVNNNNLVVAWMKFTVTEVSIAVSSSFDGGLTWSTPVSMPHFFVNSTSADPTICFRNDGMLFLSYIDYRLTIDSGATFVAQSVNGGLAWSTPVEAINANASIDLPVDRPWLVVNNSSSVNQGTLYLVTKSYKDAPFPHHIWLTESNDSGITWAAPIMVDDSIPIGPGISSMGVPSVSPDGLLHVLYLSYNPVQSFLPRYILASSANPPAGFSYNVVNTLPVSSMFSSGDSLYQYSYHVAANPDDSSNLVAIWTDNRNGDPDIYSVQSSDQGVTWSQPKRINNDSVSNGVGQDMCWAGFSPGGRYTAVWRDRRDSGPGPSSDYRIYTSLSDDGGIFFNHDTSISSMSGPLYIPVDGNDFLGVGVTDDKVYSTWADTRNTRNQIYTNSVILDSLVTGTVAMDPMNERIIIFPNPSSDEITITIGCHEFNEMIVYDLAGKKVLQVPSGLFLEQSGGQCRVKLKNLERGMYQVRLVFKNNKNEVQKIFIR